MTWAQRFKREFGIYIETCTGFAGSATSRNAARGAGAAPTGKTDLTAREIQAGLVVETGRQPGRLRRDLEAVWND
jgi:hypothetical protein